MKIQGKPKMTWLNFVTYLRFDSASADEQKDSQLSTSITNLTMNQIRDYSRNWSISRKRVGTILTQGEGQKKGQKKSHTPC
jgi:hypothetical protein